jgi:hypothetical protein
MAKNNENRNKRYAAIITLLLGLCIVELLMLTSMKYNRLDDDEQSQQLLQDSIVFGGEEYIALGDFLEPVASDDMAPNGEQSLMESDAQENLQQTGQNDLQDQGSVNEPPKQQVTTNRQSPMNVPAQTNKRPQGQTNTNQSGNPQRRGNPTNQTSKKPTNTPSSSSKHADPRVGNVFDNNNGNGQGKQGNPNGSNDGKSVGRPGVSGLDGYTLEYFPTATCPGPGTVVIRVTVSPTGSVTRANVTGGTLRSNTRACNICLNLAHKSRFRVPKGTNIDRTGTLTYKIN